MSTPREVVDAHAEDDGLWFDATTAAEAYLQQELRKLHAAVEGETMDPDWDGVMKARAREPKPVVRSGTFNTETDLLAKRIRAALTDEVLEEMLGEQFWPPERRNRRGRMVRGDARGNCEGNHAGTNQGERR